MKLHLSILASFLLLLSACSQKHEGYSIKGEIAGLPDNAVVCLVPLAHISLEPVAEAVVSNGKFEFTGVAQEPMAVQLRVKDASGSKTFMLENVDMKITADADTTLSNGNTIYKFNNFIVEGSPLTDEFQRVMAPRYRLDSIMINNQNSDSEIFDAYYKARKEGNAEEMARIEALPEFIRHREVERYCFQGFDSVLRATVAENRENIFAPIVLLAQYSYFSPDIRDIYESLSDTARNSYQGRLVYNELYPVGRPGDKLPHFEATLADGSKTTLANLCKDHKYVLLDFWASWCGPCRREIPNLKEIYGRHGENGFNIVSISIDSDAEAWQGAVKAEDLKWTNIHDFDHSIADTYKVSAVPTMYLVDSEGRLVAENLRGEELANKINELLSAE